VASQSASPLGKMINFFTRRIWPSKSQNDALPSSSSDPHLSNSSIIRPVPFFAPGANVHLHGLTTDALNRLPGVCKEYNEAKQRWVVRLSNGEIKNVKPRNLIGTGRHVRTHSLANAAFNDLQGTCQEFDDEKQRWMVRLSSGEVKAFKPENLDIEVQGEKRSRDESTEPGEESSEPPAKRARDGQKITLDKLRDIFDRCDLNKDGLVNKREFIKSCRQDEEIAKFFEVPTDIRQEGGSRDRLEEVFQAIDQDGDREIRWAELLAYYKHRVVDF